MDSISSSSPSSPPLPSSSSTITIPLLILRRLLSDTTINTNTNTNNFTILNANNDNSTVHTLHRRYQTVSLPATAYGRLDTSPSPGTVAGIVLGTVAGFLLLLYLLYETFIPKKPIDDAATVEVEEVRRPRPRPRRGWNGWGHGGGGGSYGGSYGGSEEGGGDFVDVYEEESVESPRRDPVRDVRERERDRGAGRSWWGWGRQAEDRSDDGGTVEVMEEGDGYYAPPPPPMPPPAPMQRERERRKKRKSRRARRTDDPYERGSEDWNAARGSVD